jgi:hypothetical protein
MAVHAFTSFSYSYLNRARVLAASLRKQHPDWVVWAIVTDVEPEGFQFDLANEDFNRIVTAEQLFGAEMRQWLFKHDIVEACTAVKARALQHILSEPDAEKVIYLDPDIAVFNSLSPIVDALDDSSIVLTPHQIQPDPAKEKRSIFDNEITSLGYGVFNLGFIAVKNDPEGNRFAGWWADRLHDWCYDRRDIGVFVDQKWCDLIPCFFEGVKVLRDPGCNVASWNLNQRIMSYDMDGTAMINGEKLRFFHFTKLGSVGDMMTQRYAGKNVEVYELWWWYREKVKNATDPRVPAGWWHYGTFDNGVRIPKPVRELYRTRDDLQLAFLDPYCVSDGFYKWLKVQKYL